MIIEIQYFGQAAEVVMKTEQALSFNDKQTLKTIKKSLLNQHEALTKMNLKWAVNQDFVNDDLELNDGDKIAVLPPFAGG